MVEAPAASSSSPREPKPEWLKVRAPGSENYLRLRGIMRDLKLNTVCEDAHCPNIGECWHHGTATFMILGDVCTRACTYCAVAHGKPATLDIDEPRRVGEAVEKMALKYAVDHVGRSRRSCRTAAPGSSRETIREIKRRLPDMPRRSADPRLQGRGGAARDVLDARSPTCSTTTPRPCRGCIAMARSGGSYSRTLELLDRARHHRAGHSDQDRPDGGPRRRARRSWSQVFTRPARGRRLDPDASASTCARQPGSRRDDALLPPGRVRASSSASRSDLGFVHVEAGPLVRSSYHAHEQADAYDLAHAR